MTHLATALAGAVPHGAGTLACIAQLILRGFALIGWDELTTPTTILVDLSKRTLVIDPCSNHKALLPLPIAFGIRGCVFDRILAGPPTDHVDLWTIHTTTRGLILATTRRDG